MSGWQDISVPIRSGMVHWPGDPEIEVRHMSRMKEGAMCNVTALKMGTHTGTHMDAPLHFVDDGATMDSLDFDAVIGPARVVEILNEKAVTLQELSRHDLKRGERILLKTVNSTIAWSDEDRFHEDYVYIAEDAARLMVEAGIAMVGIDYLSVGGFHHDMVETHETLLKGGVWILEGIQLKGVSGGDYDLCCLPIRTEGAEGAPARAVIRRRATS